MRFGDFIKSRYLIAVLCVLVIAAALSALFLSGVFKTTDTISENTQQSIAGSLTGADLNIEPVDFDSTGVEPGTDFKINCVKDVDPEALKSVLYVKPARSYTLKSLSGKELVLSFDQPLDSNTVYQFLLKGKQDRTEYSWAYQTKKNFTVVRTLPRDKGSYVPVNSGIEITLSHEGVEKFEEFFDISPKVQGRFEYHGKVAVFVPESLDYATLYTVTIKKGLGLTDSDEKTESDYIFQFQTEQKGGSTEQNRYFGFSDVMYNFTSDTFPVIAVGADDHYKDRELNVDLYRYGSYDQFAEALKKNDELPRWAQRFENTAFAKDKLEKFTSFKTKVIYMQSPWYQQMLTFPDKLPEGWYLVSVTIDGREYNTHIQINDISAYVMFDGSKTLVWTNTSKTGAPAPGIKVEIDGADSFLTDEKGLAVVNAVPKAEQQDGPVYLYLTPKTGPVFIVRTYLGSYYSDYYYGGYGSNNASRYWSYLYLDRGMYLPDDTIRFWGLVKPRDPGQEVRKVTVELAKYIYSNYSSEKSVLLSTELDVSALGTYTGMLKYENFNPGSCFIIVKSGEEIIEQTYIQIEKYTKPAYKIEAATDKDACFIGDEVNFSIQARFFEGSPVSGLIINYNSYRNELKKFAGKLTCQADGSAVLKYTPQPTASIMDWRPVNVDFYFENAKAEEQSIRTWKTLTVFPRDTMIITSGKVSDKKLQLEINTNRIDISKLNELQDTGIYDEYPYKGAAADIPLKVKLYERHWESEETGQYYDFINKVTRKKYRYFEVTNLVREFECNTTQGMYSTEIAIDDYSYMKTYYVDITATDTKNRAISTRQYIYSSNLYQDYLERMESYKYYRIKDDSGKLSFKTGEKISLQLLENEKEFSLPEKGRILLMTMKGGLMDHSIESTNKFSRTFSEEMIPNAFIKAVYFDGKYVQPAGEYSLLYNYEDKKLNIDIKPDKQQYRPGDIVNLDIAVTDKDGKPCESEVNLSVVDEAFFALREQWVNTAASVYSYVFNTGISGEYYSYSPLDRRYGGAECGEGGDTSVRSDFKDNAYFGTIKTDKNGNGKTSFTLPDNLTSWRVTGQALTNDLKAGNTKVNIEVRLPLFVNIISNDVYLEGDAPGITMRCFGTQINNASPVKYQVKLEGPKGLNKTFSEEQAAGKFCTIDLESLAAGSYTFTVEAVSGDLKDAVRKDFKVVENMLETALVSYKDMTDKIDILAGLDISNENSLIELTFYNKGLSRYNKILNSLCWTSGKRVDQVIARKKSAEYLKKYFSRDYIAVDETVLKQYQTGNGGIALLSYGSPDPELSAKLSSLAPEQFDKTDLEGYFINILENEKTTNEDAAAAYWGLASLGKPVLFDIRSALKDQSITLKEKLLYGNALAQLGDYSGARGVLSSIMSQYGRTAGEYKYIDGSNNDDIVAMTSLAGIIALKTAGQDAEALFNYVADKSTDEILVNLEKLIYLENMVPETEKSSSFSADINGKKEKYDIKGSQRLSKVFTLEMLKNAAFYDVNGDIEVAVAYTGPLSDTSAEKNNTAVISRNYSVNGIPTNSFKQSDIVVVTLDIQLSDAAPEGFYQITDILPSGLRYIPPRYWELEDWRWGDVNGQKVDFGYYYGSTTKKHGTIRYLARVVSSGSYTADNAVITHVKSQAYSFTEKVKVKISEE